jgi:hypothetical protein
MAIAKTEQTGEAMGIAKTEQTNASVWWLISALDVFLEVASFYVENKYNVWFLVLSKCTCLLLQNIQQIHYIKTLYLLLGKRE